MNDSLHVDGSADIDGNLNVDGTLDAGTTDIDGSLDVSGHTELNDSLHVDGGVDFDSNLNVDGNTNIVGTTNVDGATTLNSTLDVDGATTLNSSLDVDGHTELNDSLHVDGGVDFDSNLNVDGNTNIVGTTNVDGATTLNSTLDVDGATTLNSSLDVDGHTELNDSLHVDGGVDFDSNLNVDGNLDVWGNTYMDGTLTVNDSAQFNDNVNVDATLTADTAIVEEFLQVLTPLYPSADSQTLSEPELEVLNVDGDPIFEIDGHNDDVIAENLTVNGVFTTQDWIVNDDISADDIHAAGFITAGGTTFGNEWANSASQPNNWLTRKDYVDFHRQAATGVIQAFSYDAALIGGAAGADYNASVYYMDGDLVLYADSVDSANGKNYTVTVKGENFNSLTDEDGAPLTIEAAIWFENNSLSITNADHNFSVVDDNTITFEIGYEDVNGIAACTSGKVRPTLALGSATYGMQMTGLHFFIEIEETPSAP